MCFSFWRSTSAALVSKCRNLTKQSERNEHNIKILFKVLVTSLLKGSHLMYSDTVSHPASEYAHHKRQE